LDFSTACLIDPADSVCKTVVVVLGQGTWRVNIATGDPTFTPAPNFSGLATAITYSLSDKFGQKGSNTLNITVGPDTTPLIVPKSKQVLTGPGVATSISSATDFTPPLGDSWNRQGTKLVDPISGKFVNTYSNVKGTWTVTPKVGTIVFTPKPNFYGVATIRLNMGTSNGLNVVNTFTSVVARKIKISVYFTNNSPILTPVDIAKLKAALKVVGGGKIFETQVAGFVLISPSIVADKLLSTQRAKSTAKFIAAYGLTNIVATGQGCAPERNSTARRAEITINYLPAGTPLGELDIVDVAKSVAPVGSKVSVTTPLNTSKIISPKVTGTGLDYSTACILDLSDSICKSVVLVKGQGSWSVDTSTGAVTFTPEPNFSGVAIPMTFSVSNKSGQKGTSVLAITVGVVSGPALVQKVKQVLTGPGVATSISSAAEFTPPVGDSWNLQTSKLVNPISGQLVSTYTNTKGTWTVTPKIGNIVFTPKPNFYGVASIGLDMSTSKGLKVLNTFTSVVVRKIKLMVYFTNNSPVLTPVDIAKLKAAIKVVDGGEIYKTQVDGYVLTSASLSEDQLLSTLRAQSTSKFIAAYGLTNIVATGKGRAIERNSLARRAEITINYLPAGTPFNSSVTSNIGTQVASTPNIAPGNPATGNSAALVGSSVPTIIP
jgi:CshA-type fibril repeat protein